MFNALHNGSTLFLLDKSRLTLRVGQVQNVSLPKPSVSQPFGMANSTIDIVVAADGESINLPNIPSGLSVATVNGIIVSETKEGIDTEIEGIQRTLQTHIDNYDEYKRAIVRCKEVRKELNPQLAKEQAQEEKIASLENSINELKAMLTQSLSRNKNHNENHTNNRGQSQQDD